MALRLGFSPDTLVRTVNRANVQIVNTRLDVELKAIGDIHDYAQGFVRLNGTGEATAIPWNHELPNSVVIRNSDGAIVATVFIGSGSGLTSLNASSLSTGVVPFGRLPIATNIEAIAGTSDSKVMTPVKTKTFLQEGNYSIDLGEF